jgi:hypothetical protein
MSHTVVSSHHSALAKRAMDMLLVGLGAGTPSEPGVAGRKPVIRKLTGRSTYQLVDGHESLGGARAHIISW